MRGFRSQEYQARLARAQAAMAYACIDALLLTTEADLRYFSGFLTRFWESPTRPWYLIVPLQGDPIAVIPSIGAELMGQTWIKDIRTWQSPDYGDDGVSLLAETLNDLVAEGGQIGLPQGNGSHLRMPLSDWQKLCAAIGRRHCVSDKSIMRDCRMVKSDAEVAKIEAACAVANRSFARVHEIAKVGVPLSDVFRKFQILCLEEGADWVPYLAGGADQGGYGDVISPASDRPLQSGDVLMLDTGLVVDGYFCDFDRNFAIGEPDKIVADGHNKLIEAAAAAFESAKPGATAADLFHVMDRVLTGGAGGSIAGRLGHGLGMQLTEPPSLIPADTTTLLDGMVLTLEPSIQLSNGRILVHEENIVVRNGGAKWLSKPAAPAIQIL